MKKTKNLSTLFKKNLKAKESETADANLVFFHQPHSCGF